MATRLPGVTPLQRPFLLILSLAALITGILAMHVWMGGHGSTRHQVSAAPAAQLISETAAGPQNAGTLAEGHGHSADASPTGCADTCGENNLLTGMCMLALVLIGFLGLHLLLTRAVQFFGQTRAPPRITLHISTPRMTPSLTQLSISRT